MTSRWRVYPAARPLTAEEAERLLHGPLRGVKGPQLKPPGPMLRRLGELAMADPDFIEDLAILRSIYQHQHKDQGHE